MSEKKHGLPKARIGKSYFSWLLWLVPIGAVCLCAWFVAHDVLLSGPTITIYFPDADGLQAGDSQLKHHGVKIGDVKSLSLTRDGQSVAIQVHLLRAAAGVARTSSRFWIVHPQVSFGGIKGLGTILSGNYIAVEPGDGPRTNSFTGLTQAPIPPIKGLQITLLTDTLEALEKQSPILYNGIQVGEVLDFNLSDNSTNIVVHANIRAQYAPLVRINSKFWHAGGVNFHFGIFSGLRVNADSVQTLVSGGIAFANPPDYGPAATGGMAFRLYKKEDAAWKSWNAAIPLNIPDMSANPQNSLSTTNSP